MATHLAGPLNLWAWIPVAFIVPCLLHGQGSFNPELLACRAA
jgi:hypothetical protein